MISTGNRIEKSPLFLRGLKYIYMVIFLKGEGSMDVQLKELIETIKKEGVQNAEEQSSQIIKNAEEKANKIIKEAEEKASGIVKAAQEEAAKSKMTGKASLKQAGRDLILDVQDRLKAIFTRLTEEETAAHFDGDTLRNAIEAVIKGWVEKNTSDLTVLVPDKLLNSLEKSFFEDLASEMKTGIEVKPFPDIKAGFRIIEKDGRAYYDFSAETVAEVLSKYLNDRLASIVAEAAENKES